MRGRGIHGIVANHLHANGPLAQPLVIEGQAGEWLARSRNKDVGRAIVRVRRGNPVDARSDSGPDVTLCLGERVTNISAPLSPPDIVDSKSHLLCQQGNELVLKALPGTVGEGQVVGIRADSQRRCRHEQYHLSAPWVVVVKSLVVPGGACQPVSSSANFGTGAGDCEGVAPFCAASVAGNDSDLT